MKLITLEKLNSFLSDLLKYEAGQVDKIDPYMSNGLMVKGKEEIKKIGFGVSASLELFKLAKDQNCDVIICHHSFNIPTINAYNQIFQNRMEFLINNKISLFGFHFLLDWHPVYGNNAQIMHVIKAKLIKPYLFHGSPWGWVGELEDAQTPGEILEKLSPFLSKTRTIYYDFGKKVIKRIVVVSGKGAPHAEEMDDLLKNEIDLYITGEAHEWNRELFREAKINFIAGGHYHTEVFGLKALMDEIKKKMNLEVCWLSLTNDI